MEPNIPQENMNSPVQPTAPIQPRQNNQIRSWLGFVVIFVSIVIFFGGVFAWQYFFVKPPVVVEAPQVQNQNAGWKTYTNTQYGFEIEYPLNFYISNDNGDDFGVNIERPEEKNSRSTMFTIATQEIKLPIENWIDINFPVGSIVKEDNIYIGRDKSIKTFNINNYPVWQFIDHHYSDNVYYSIFQKSSNRFVEIVYRETANSDNADLTIYNKMLSTFKFTESITQALDQRIRKVDLTKFMEISPESYQSIDNIEYADLDNDGQEEAIFTIFSGGTAGSDGPVVVGFINNVNNKLTQFKIGDYASLLGSLGQGHMSFLIVKNNLIAAAPIFEVGDPNCCPTGGNMYILFKLVDLTRQFVVDKTLKLTPEWGSKSVEEIKQELIKKFNI